MNLRKPLGLHTGTCKGCGHTRLVNAAVTNGKFLTGYYCGDCWERLGFDQDRGPIRYHRTDIKLYEDRGDCDE